MPAPSLPLGDAIRRWAPAVGQVAAGALAGAGALLQAPLAGLALAALVLLALSARPRRVEQRPAADQEDTLVEPDCDRAAAELRELLDRLDRRA